MKKHFALLLLVSCWFHLPVTAQFYNQRSSFLKANSKLLLWESGVDFNIFPPQVFPVPPILNNNPAFYWFDEDEIDLIVSDPVTAQPLFACNDRFTLNRDMQPFPHSDTLAPYWSTRNNYAIIRFPGDPSRYYRFDRSVLPLPDQGGIPQFILGVTHSVIDLNLENGLGDIAPAQKGIALDSSVGNIFEPYGLMGIPGNNCDAWLLAWFIKDRAGIEAPQRLRFQSYHIDAGGVDPVPKVFELESPGAGLFIAPALSPDRKTLAFWEGNSRDGFWLRLLRFDPEDGMVTAGVRSKISFTATEIAPLTIDQVFSPDGQKMILCRQYGFDSATFTILDFTDRNNLAAEENSFPDPYYFFYPFNAQIGGSGAFDIRLRSYGGKVYFNISRDTVYHSVYGLDSGVANAVAVGALAPSAQGWSAPVFEPPIPLTGQCRSLHSMEITIPLEATDTFADHYKDTLLCGDFQNGIPAFDIHARPGFSAYVWDDGTTGPDRTVNHTGTYWVTYQGVCNTRIDTIGVNIKPQAHILTPDTVVCEQRFPFTLTAGSAGSYLWDNGATTASTLIYHPGQYAVTFFKEDCYQSDSISVTSKYCPCSVGVPDAFSPNNDGLNDFFKPIITQGCVPSEYSLRIFNRWGQVVYGSFKETDKGWNGWDKGRQADAGTYFYELRFRSRYLEKEYVKKGELVLIR